MSAKVVHPPASSVRRLLLALIPLAMVVLASEGALWLLELGQRPHYLSRGFNPDAAYLIPAPDQPGAWRPQLYGDKRDDTLIPPKGDAVRVLLFGGSNTRYFPESMLASMLQVADPQHREFEVINLGREGYGSERVRILFKQSLALQPDAVLLYSGHNEFLERGFAHELDALSGGSFLHDVAGVFSHLRLFNVMADTLSQHTPVQDTQGHAPEKMDPAAGDFAEMTREETERFYLAYGENLASICAMARDAGVPVVMCTVVSNMLAPPYVYDVAAELGDEQASEYALLLNKGIRWIPERFRQGLVPPDRVRLRVTDWFDGQSPPAYEAPVLRGLSGSLAGAGEREGDRRLASAEGAHWPVPAHWNDKVRRVLGTMGMLMNRELSMDDKAALRRATNILEPLHTRMPEDPFLCYYLGLLTWLVGADDSRAVELLSQANGLDRAPRRGNRRTNAVVRRVATEESGVTLLDAEHLVKKRCPAGLVGYEVLMDHCHLQPGAKFAVAIGFTEALCKALGVEPVPKWVGRANRQPATPTSSRQGER